MKKLRIFCRKKGRDKPFAFDLPAMSAVGHPVFTETIFDLIECDEIRIVPKKAATVDLRKKPTADEIINCRERARNAREWRILTFGPEADEDEDEDV